MKDLRQTILSHSPLLPNPIHSLLLSSFWFSDWNVKLYPNGTRPIVTMVASMPHSWQCVCVCAKSLQSCWTLRPHGLQSTRLLCPWDSLDKNTGVGCHALLQGIFPKQESNSSLLCLLCWQAGSLPLVPPGRESRKAPQGPWGKRAATLLWSPYPPQFPTHTHDLWNHKLAQAL